jgi:hypothetical protein
MPRKKLTKKQVMSKLRSANNSIGDLLMDKTYNPDSRVPMSTIKLNEMINVINRMFLKVKRL